MAYPVITDHFRVQVVMQHSSGLPEDVFINNLYFRNDTVGQSPANFAAAVAGVLDTAYGTSLNGSSALKEFIPNSVIAVTYKVYDLGEAPPRYPVTEPIAASWVGEGATKWPQEVALCLSFKGGPAPKQRGRIYIGPLVSTAVTSTAVDPRPSASILTSMGRMAQHLMEQTPLGAMTWVVVSPTYAETTIVTEAWIDDAWDTQRSRGLAATTRSRWNAAGPVA